MKFLGKHIKWKIPIVKIRSCIPREALSYNDAWRISNELRSSFYLAHYLICRGGEFGSLIFNPKTWLYFIFAWCFPTHASQALSSLQIPRCLKAYYHPMMAWPPSKTMIPPLIFPHDLIHLGISPSLESNHSKGLPSKEVLQNNIAQKKISGLGS